MEIVHPTVIVLKATKRNPRYYQFLIIRERQRVCEYYFISVSYIFQKN